MDAKAGAPQPRRLLDQVRDKLRTLHYSPRTEDAYVGWIRHYILFQGKRHPKDLGAAEVEAFLTYLATDRRVSASTQNQALCALLFLYKQVLGVELGWVDGVTPAKKPERVPVVMTREEVGQVLAQMRGRDWLAIPGTGYLIRLDPSPCTSGIALACPWGLSARSRASGSSASKASVATLELRNQEKSAVRQTRMQFRPDDSVHSVSV
jgi:hypothetical protein